VRRLAVATLSFVVALAFVGALPAASGGLDPSFGTRGKVFTDFSHGDVGSAMALQPDGKIVVVGETQSPTDYVFAIARYHSNGRLDKGFDRDGKLTLGCGDLCAAYAVAVQEDGSILVGGSGDADFALVRLKPDGSRDSAFGTRGWADIGFDDGMARAIALQPDGKILVVGTSYGERSGLALARLTPEGLLDPSFGRAGRAIIHFGSHEAEPRAVLRPDGKLVVAASVWDRKTRVWLLRIDAKGRVDRRFGRGGLVRTTVRGASPGLAVQADGKLVIVGAHEDSVMVARYSPNGKIDGSFGRAGLVGTTFPMEKVSAGGIAIDPRGRITVAVSRGAPGPRGPFLALFRISGKGRLDSSFGRGGRTGESSRGEEPTAVAIQRNGRILVGGTRTNERLPNTRKADFFVARFLGG
jgi:uncharacterized delta-60 repeat protein